ncbi:ABC transporter ATP-binding protein [Microbacterium sp.]|uniref:ABC transporter ATP-binding protein n=1 Tax=Microbacterium sp. TaxID=51671 RepID=UPI003C730668
MLSDSDVFLTLQDVGRSYGTGSNAVHALNGVNLRVRRGRLMVILGPSGSGKSTLLNLLGGMDTPSTGRILHHGTDGRRRDLSRLSDAALTEYRRAHVGFVFQFYNLVSNLTAFENVALAAALVTDRKTADAAATRALRGVGLAKRSRNFPGQLSGGEMQRVAIARALAKSPAMLVCDEPTGALDTRTGIDVMTILEAIAYRTRTAVVVVTHNPAFADLAHHLVRLQDGYIVESRHNDSPLTVADLD